MKPTREIDTTQAPGGGELALTEHDGYFYIHLDGQALLSTRATFAHETLAQLGCDHIATHPKPKVLIGGLGMGMILRATLEVLGRAATVTVAENLPEMIEWNRMHFGEANGEVMTDPRAEVVEEDFMNLMGSSPEGFHAIFTDLDSGPEVMMGDLGSGGYDAYAVEMFHTALKPGGVLAIASARKVPAFAKLLRSAGFDVDAFGVKAYAAGKKPQNSVILARRRN